MSVITNDDDIKRGMDVLAGICPHMRMIGETIGPPPLRWREPGFAGLVSTITAQQLSVSSANAIRTKLMARLDPLTPGALLGASEEELRACGLSGPKIRTLRALADAIVSGDLPFDSLAEMPVPEAQAALVRVHGIGPWTAEVYMMFCLGVQDIFAPADLALQEGAKLAMGLPTRPTTKEMAEIATRWAPWRAVAARMLWAWYGHVKRRQGVVSA
ncbi:DNA-3-methyladenine glycosylase 2 family protein [Rhabdaerophilum sp. SD176]|uniref:DNA-3-methyladenine glycosylase family protein n=1 Tax=Rhabdaerophilum sp. SD176 TaxID=2983548 RepID=UPI0024E03221|nr:DNA-3-methyladenine glycosylase 2 family protein [Rhabdaerophilum sp. SD176]